MKIQAMLVGSGTEEDPYRVDLPTWVLVDVDYDRMEAIVSIPDDVFPLPAEFDTITVKDTKGKDHEIIIPKGRAVDAWRAIEEERYPQFAGRRHIRDVVRRR